MHIRRIQFEQSVREGSEFQEASSPRCPDPMFVSFSVLSNPIHAESGRTCLIGDKIQSSVLSIRKITTIYF